MTLPLKPIRDVDQEVYERQRAARTRMMTGLRALSPRTDVSLPSVPPAREDTVVAIANLTPDGAGTVDLTAAEQRITAMLERRADAAMAHDAAHHERVRAAMRGKRR